MPVVVREDLIAIIREIRFRKGLAGSGGEIRFQLLAIALPDSLKGQVVDDPLWAFHDVHGDRDLSRFALVVLLHCGGDLHVAEAVGAV